jgi:hypothetical protein
MMKHEDMERDDHSFAQCQSLGSPMATQFGQIMPLELLDPLYDNINLIYLEND